MKYTRHAPDTDGTTRVDFAFTPREIRGHPDRFKVDVGDIYQGMRIVRDASIPKNELHLIDGNHCAIVRFKDAA